MRELRLMLWRVAEPEWEDTRFEVKTAVIKQWLKEMNPKDADFMCRPYGEGRVHDDDCDVEMIGLVSEDSDMMHIID